jgi:hypothetical protein
MDELGSFLHFVGFVLFWSGVSMVGVYILTRLASIAYFKSKEDYEHHREVVKYLIEHPRRENNAKTN